MWPRTAEERSRGRNTGFVCFMTRDDAQEAMDAFQDSDPLKTGRRMCLRWGKNVKKSVKRGTGGVPIPPIRMKEKNKYASTSASGNDEHVLEITLSTNRVHEYFNKEIDKKRKRPLCELDSLQQDSRPVNYNVMNHEASSSSTVVMGDLQSAKNNKSTQLFVDIPVFNPIIHSSDAIRVILPSDPIRLKFITMVASFVAKDGSILEKKMIEKESRNPKFFFLLSQKSLHDSLPGTVPLSNYNSRSADDEIMKERIFYRWRVFAFTQGDGFDLWRTEPFIMIQPQGRFWIPPSLNAEAARREEEEAKQKEEHIRIQQEERRKLAGKKDFMTGRQLEHAKFGGSVTAAAEGAAKLNDYEMEQWNDVIKNKLCASRAAICEAMAFCFDKSGAAKQISELIFNSLLDDGKGVSVETRIARLYLMSDVLFNSQQPGVKNAFFYRDAIQSMACEVFDNLGKTRTAGRMTMNKMRKAVSSVLNAWSNWSVYNTAFLDELETRFEGKKLSITFTLLKHEEEENEVSPVTHNDDKSANVTLGEECQCQNSNNMLTGKWVDTDIILRKDVEEMIGSDVDGTELGNDDIDGEIINDDDVDGESLDDEDLDENLLDIDDLDRKCCNGDVKIKFQ